MNILTTAGENLIGRAVAGETITFTRFKAGNGNAPSAPESLTDLVNPLLSFDVEEIDKTVTGKVSITGSFNSSDAPVAFRVKEVGLYAEGDDNTEVLVFYINHGDDAGVVDPDNASENAAYSKTVVIEVERTDTIEAIVINPSAYATKAELNAHADSTDNPHEVTAAQVGLGNVPNVATNDQTPTYAEASTLEEISSGETLSTIFGKIKKAIKSLIAHLSSTSNPHSVTIAQVGAAAASHQHSTADLTSGVLDFARGGTGKSSEADLLKYLHTPVFGMYAGDGVLEREIDLGFKPAAVLITDCYGKFSDGNGHPTGGYVIAGYINTIGGAVPVTEALIRDSAWDTQSSSLRITNKGFKVVYRSSKNILTNDPSRFYYYVAWR